MFAWRDLRQVVIAAAWLVGSLAWTSVAGGQPKRDDVDVQGDAVVDEAREHFNNGVRFSAAGKVEAALAAFQRAYDLVPNWKILYNIGQTSRHVRDYGRSLRAFERYIAEGKDEISRGRRAEVDKEILALRALVGRIDPSVRPPSGTLFVDDVRVGEIPLLEPVAVTPGRRRVKVTGPGGTAVQDVEVAQGATARVELVVEPAAAPAQGKVNGPPRGAAVAMPRVSASPAADYSTHAAVSWVATGVFALGAAGIGAWALVESDDLASSAYKGPDRRPPPDSALRSQASRVETLAWIADGLVAAAVIGAGAGVYFTFVAGGSSTRPQGSSYPRSADAGSSAALRHGSSGLAPVSVAVTPRGAWMSGAF